jgi:hypothetical protein
LVAVIGWVCVRTIGDGSEAMNAMTLNAKFQTVPASTAGTWVEYLDPLDADESSDAVVTTSRRALTRVALVAAEAGARFQREGIGHDPMAWMLAPRRLFRGSAALEACLDRDNCLRAVLLHGLSIGLDATPARIDAILADDLSGDDFGGPWSGGARGDVSGGAPSAPRLRLYSAVVVIARGGELLHAFHASLAPSAAVVRERIRARFGSAAAAQAEIRVGFDPECPATMGMVPPAVVDTLIAVGRRRRRASFEGLDITVEQRLPS